jgi:hypothetical protein
MKILSDLSKLISVIILSISYAKPLIAADNLANGNNNSTIINSADFKLNHDLAIAGSSQNTQDYQSPIFTNFSYPPTS